MPLGYRDFEDSMSYFEKLAVIREYYEMMKGYHFETYRNTGNMRFKPYPFNWNRIFTPIEQRMWILIRHKNCMPFFPQYPVGKYYIDFGNPFLKIGIEVDGKEWHDLQKDRLRDRELKKLGWTIIRISGTEVERTNFKNVSVMIDEYDFDNDMDKYLFDAYYWLNNTGDGILEAIRFKYFNGDIQAYDEEAHATICAYADASINKHIII